MKNNKIFLNRFFVLMGVCFLITTGCKKEEQKADEDNTIPTNIVFVQIPGGTFIMGSDSNEVGRTADETQHKVTIGSFRMSKYEITNSQFADFLNAKNIGSNGKWAAGRFPYQALVFPTSGNDDWGLHYTNEQWIPAMGYENNPAILVTWFGAREFAKYAGGRLPTEAEWEYACRANTSTPFNTGSCLNNTQANYDWAYPYNTCLNTNTIHPGKTQVVGTYNANAFGLHDMHGNVWEWCSDLYGPYPAEDQTNPTGPATGWAVNVLRGGGGFYGANYCRSAYRYDMNPDVADISFGFRMVIASE